MPASEIVFSKIIPAYVMMDQHGHVIIDLHLPNFEVNVKWQLNNTTAAEPTRDPLTDEEVPF